VVHASSDRPEAALRRLLLGDARRAVPDWGPAVARKCGMVKTHRDALAQLKVARIQYYDFSWYLLLVIWSSKLRSRCASSCFLYTEPKSRLDWILQILQDLHSSSSDVQRYNIQSCDRYHCYALRPAVLKNRRETALVPTQLIRGRIHINILYITVDSLLHRTSGIKSWQRSKPCQSL
jgi:hypothetical protein